MSNCIRYLSENESNLFTIKIRIFVEKLQLLKWSKRRPSAAQVVEETSLFHGHRRLITVFLVAATGPYPEPTDRHPLPFLNCAKVLVEVQSFLWHFISLRFLKRGNVIDTSDPRIQLLYIRVTLHCNKFLLNNQTDALIIPILFCYKTLHVSGIFSAHHQEFSTVHSALVKFHAGFWWPLPSRVRMELQFMHQRPAWNLPVPNVQ